MFIFPKIESGYLHGEFLDILAMLVKIPNLFLSHYEWYDTLFTICRQVILPLQ